MQFFHGTTKAGAECILGSSIEPSEFSIDDYLTALIKSAAAKPPKSYQANGETVNTKWLGQGIYLFDTFNKSEAINWRVRYGNPKTDISECTAIRVNMDDVKEDGLFDLFSYSGRSELKRVLEDKFVEVIEKREDLTPLQMLSLVGLQVSLVESLDNLFDKDPYLGGVAIDLYNLLEDGEIKLVRGIYKKGTSNHYYDVYYCLKDKDLIKELQPI